MRKLATAAVLAIAVIATAHSGLGQRTSARHVTLGSRPTSGALEVTAATTDGMTFEARAGALQGQVLHLPEGRFLDLRRSEGTTTEIGAPALPVLGALVDVPYGARDVRVRILDEEWKVLRLPELYDADYLMPFQPPMPKVQGARENAELHLNRSAYARSTFGPETKVLVSDAGIMRGHRLMRVSVHPVQYNPMARSVRVLSRMTFQLTYEGADWEATERIQKRYASPFFDRVFENRVANHALHGRLAASTRGGRSAALALPVGYLIIAHDSLVSTIQSLADWKEHIGYDVTVAGTSTAGTTTSQIKNYIQTAYDTWPIPPQFVLLVGDSNLIPGFQGGESYAITDLDYVLMDAGNFLPDIFIGRFSARTTTHLTNILDKVLYYEQLDTTSEPWVKKAAFMAGYDNYTVSEGTHNYVISNYLNPAGYTSDKLYQVTYGATTADVSNSLNDGRSLAVFSGHGSTTSWADGPPFSQGNVNALTNLYEYPVACSHACVTGDFSVTECFAETWQRAPGKAGVVFWGSAPSTYWDEDDILEKGMFETGFGDGNYVISEMTNGGLMAVNNYYSGGGLTEYYYEGYHVFGEPSMFLRTEQPLVPVVTHETALAVGSAVLNVSVTAGGPVEDALVHVAKGTEVFDSVYTDATGTATLNISTLTPGIMELVVTGHNLVMYEADVTIFVPSGPYVVLDDYIVDDTVGGNGDGDIDIGEAIELPVAGYNVGTTTAFGVVATLGSTDPMVTITDATETLGNITSGSVVWTPDDFDFTVDANCPDGYLVPFTVTFTDSGSNSWDYAVNLVVNAPNVVFDAYTVTEAPGNGNGWADPGETVNIGLDLLNDGHHVAEDVSVQLHTADPYCTITQGTSDYVDLLPDAAGSNLTILSADISSSCPTPHDMLVNADIYCGVDLIGTEQIVFTVGKTPVLVVDLDPNHTSAPSIEAALTALGVSHETTLSWPTDFDQYQSVFVCLGIFYDNTELTSSQANALVAFMQGGGRAYMEGGDCWYYDDYASTYRDDFGINALDDGSSDTGTILGQSGTFTAGMSFSYTGENNWMDQISARSGASLIFRNQSPSYGDGVAYDAGAYKSVGLAFEFGGLVDGTGGTKLALMMEICRFLDIEVRRTYPFWPL